VADLFQHARKVSEIKHLPVALYRLSFATFFDGNMRGNFALVKTRRKSIDPEMDEGSGIPELTEDSGCVSQLNLSVA
jgi:hypothetical protein